MHVVLVNPPIRLPYAFAHYPMFSTLGLLYNASWLRQNGHDVRVVDAFTLKPSLNLRDCHDGFRHLGAELGDLADAVARTVAELGEPCAVVMSITMFSDMNRGESLVPAAALAVRERLPDVSLGLADLFTCGMNYFPYDPRALLEQVSAADWLLLGEGEPTLPALMTALEAGAPLDFPRTAHRKADGEVVVDERAPEPLRGVDELPPPAFDLLDMDNYFSTQAEAIAAELVHEYHVVERQLPLMTSRGCPFRCNFCTNQVLSLPWRSHSVDYLRSTLKDLRDRYRVDRFLFLDDNINVNEKRFGQLVRMLADEGLPWDAVNGFRADHLDAEMVRAIKQAGNTKITVSAESGDPELLEQLIGKRLQLSSVVKLARLCQAENMPLQVHYIIGIPGETLAQMNQTVEFATVLFEKHGAWPLLQHAIPFPGTRMFQDCEQQGYFAKHPFEVSGSELELRSIIQTPEFGPGEVGRIKQNTQHLLDTTQALVHIDLAPEGKPALTKDAAQAELERRAFLGGREVFFGGGDPTTRADLVELTRYARSVDFRRVTVIGPGHGLVEGPEELARAIDHLVVPLHGPHAESHDAIVGNPGAFRQTLLGIRAAGRYGLDSLEISCTVTSKNLPLLSHMVALARKLGARGLHFSYPAPDEPAARAGLVPRWEAARPWLLGALRLAPRGYASIQGVPMCLLRKPAGALRPSPPWVIQRTRRLKAKHEQCKSCVGLILCGGFYSSEHEPSYGFVSPLPEPEEQPLAAS